MSTLTLQDVQAARDRIRESIYYSPCAHSNSVSRISGQQVFLKLENLQKTGAFKERGALNKLLTLSKAEQAQGVIAASAGNHAQGVAYHARHHGISAKIVMPTMTPLVKVNATASYGADVVLSGSGYDEAYEEARRLAKEENRVFVHPFDDPAVIAGQGTIGLELLEQIPDLEAVVVPIGGGGLISGIACAIKESKPSVRVIGVQAARMPSTIEALKAHKPTTIAANPTIADGIAVRRAGEITLPLVEKYVDEVVAVEEEEIASGILTLLEREKTLAEGAGAAAVAALLHHRTSLQDKRVAALVCGGNIDVTLLSRIIQRGLVKDGRLVRLQVHLSDRPGALLQLTKLIASHHTNIVELQFDRAYYGVSLGDTLIDITLETRGPEQIKQLLAALVEAGYRHERIQ
ncbi:MAG: threonine ammonia-lyase [Acidobacteria bacterium]|jgi:threonine dehydratase|nr:threonine ammonia-lyase [Acidobacteriota bacterium]